MLCHNPYFSRWFSAIKEPVLPYSIGNDVTILILVDGFLQYCYAKKSSNTYISHNPYFSRWFSAMKKEIL